ncbi:MAG: hypothetical protein EBR79_00840 [Proteobacteria bacterium]|nr:hypothetical protein [Pseudomonadota bacterium]NBX86689.1 hypothetical protein [Pseudomonadota bacterium]
MTETTSASTERKLRIWWDLDVLPTRIDEWPIKHVAFMSDTFRIAEEAERYFENMAIDRYPNAKGIIFRMGDTYLASSGSAYTTFMVRVVTWGYNTD